MSNSQGKQNRPSGMFTKESVDEYRRRTTRFDLGDIKFRRIYPFWGAFMLMLVVVIAVSSLRTSVEHETTIIASGSMCRSLLTNGRLGSSQRIHVALIRRDDGRAVTLVGGTRFAADLAPGSSVSGELIFVANNGRVPSCLRTSPIPSPVPGSTIAVLAVEEILGVSKLPQSFHATYQSNSVISGITSLLVGTIDADHS